MEKANKKRIKKYVSWICLVALVAFLAVMPLLAGSEKETDGPQASILSGSVERKDVSTELIGGGALAEAEALEITIPASVKLTKYLAFNGDTVTDGDPIASVDRVTVMTAISQVQETLEYLAEEMENAGDEETAGKVTAQAGGIVKLLYAQEGDNVADVMLEHGALAVLSLDGLMEAKLSIDTTLSPGDSVTATLPDGTEAAGKVASNLDGILTVTIRDDGYAVGETVQLTAETGATLGSGTLSIHSPWTAVAYSGTVSQINVSEGEEMDAGDTLLELENAGQTAEYRQLSDQHRKYEELMLELFQMYQDELIRAPGSGVVSGVDEDSAVLLSAEKEQWTLDLLMNAPNGDDETGYSNYVGQISSVGIDGLVLKVNPQTLQITDYKDLTGIPTDPAAMTEDVIYSPQVPIYQLAGGEWIQIAPDSLTAGDILLFAGDADGNFVWIVRVNHTDAPTEPSVPTEPSAPTEPTTEPIPPTDSTVPSEPGPSAQPTEPTQPSEPSEPVSGALLPSGQTQAGNSAQPSGSYPQISGSFSGGTVEQEPEFELYGLETVTVASVTAQETMTVEITVDELDVSKISLGQTANITISALPGEHFAGTVTGISNSGTSEGGNSKFTAEITVERIADMLPGMNATAQIPLDTAADVLTVPVAALNDDGTQTFLYTGYDEKTGTLADPLTVTVGASDGETAQILTGADEGTTYYYAYYDTPEISNAPEAAGFSFRR